MNEKYSLWCQLKVIGGAALTLLAILIFGIVLPNVDDLHSETQSNLTVLGPSAANTSLVIISNFTDPVNDERKDFILGLVNSTWTQYIEYVTEEPNLDPTDHTLAMSLSTLWMLDFKTQFNRTWELFQRRFNREGYWKSVEVQKVVTEVLGSMVSCYALTGDVEFLDVARKVTEKLGPAYDNRTGISYPTLTSNIFDNEKTATLSEVGGQFLEYLYFASVLNSSNLISERLTPTLSNLNATKAEDGYYVDRLFVPSGIWATTSFSLYSSTSGFFQSLLKSYLVSNRTRPELFQVFADAFESVEAIDGFFGTSKTGLKYTREYDYSLKRLTEVKCMRDEGCYLGGLLALAAQELKELNSIQKRDVPEESTGEEFDVEMPTTSSSIDGPESGSEPNQTAHWMSLAEALTETCYQAAIRSPDRLLPEVFCFDDRNEATNRVDEEADFWDRKVKGNALRSDLAESYLILWRLTGKEKYRSMAWQMAQAIGRYLKSQPRNYRRDSSSGSFEFGSDFGPQSRTPEYRPPGQLLGATLKYLYLIFSDVDFYSLDRWIFSTTGQPIPVVGD